MVVEPGVTTVAAVASPLLQAKVSGVEPPVALAVSVAEAPAQIVDVKGVIEGVIAPAAKVTLTEAVAEQVVAELVTVTV